LLVHVNVLVRLNLLEVFDNVLVVLESVLETAADEMGVVGEEESGVEVPEVGELERGEEELDVE